jgi:thioredoxin-like negative regulator of GroEL
MLELTLLGRPGCHLCDELAEALAPLVAAGRIRLEKADVDAEASLAGRFGRHVPVLLAEGAVLCAHRLDAARLDAVLAGQRWEPLELD